MNKYPTRIATDEAVRRHVLGQHGAGGYRDAIADRNRSGQYAAGTDPHVVPDPWEPLVPFGHTLANRDVLVECAMLTDHDGIDDDTHPVHEDKARPDLSTNAALRNRGCRRRGLGVRVWIGVSVSR